MSETIQLKNDKLSIEINSKGACLKSAKDKDGKEFMWSADPAIWAGVAPILFPICGGLKQDKFTFEGEEYTLQKHGYAREVEYEVEEATETSAVFLHKSNEVTKQSYPFDYEFRVKFALDGNKIAVTYETSNLSGKNMYFSVGAHEGYICPQGIEEYKVKFEKTETLDAWELDGNLLSGETKRIITDSDTLELKKEYFAIDALVFKDVKSRSVELVHNGGERKIKVGFEGCDYFVLWSRPTGEYLCIEPWCGIQETADSPYDITKKEGIIELAPNQKHSVTHTIEFE